MLIREKTADAAKSSLLGTGVFSDARFDLTSLQDHEINHKTDSRFLNVSAWRVAYGAINWDHFFVFTLLLYLVLYM